MTTEIAQFMHQLERTWDAHVAALLERRDLDAAMVNMTAEPSVRHLPTMTGADGRSALESFYRDALLPCLPADLGWTEGHGSWIASASSTSSRSRSCTTASSRG